LLPP
jgi:hypothetical protein